MPVSACGQQLKWLADFLDCGSSSDSQAVIARIADSSHENCLACCNPWSRSVARKVIIFQRLGHFVGDRGHVERVEQGSHPGR